MNFIFFILFAILAFMCVLIGGKKYQNTTLYTLAIGGAVNANFFHSGNFAINCFGLPFGIDSVLYTLFIFCVIVMFIKHGKSQAWLLAISGIVAIMFSATTQLVAKLMSNGSSFAVWAEFLGFFASGVASLIAIFVMIMLMKWLSGKINNYVLTLICGAAAILINCVIYYPLMLLINGLPSNISLQLFASIIGKAISMVISIFTLWLLNLYGKRNAKKINGGKIKEEW